jgi:hypothetical protein
MTSSSTIHVGAGYSWVAILLDKLRLSCFSACDFPKSMMCTNPLIAHAAIGSQEEHGCSKEHAGL